MRAVDQIGIDHPGIPLTCCGEIAVLGWRSGQTEAEFEVEPLRGSLY